MIRCAAVKRVFQAIHTNAVKNKNHRDNRNRCCNADDRKGLAALRLSFQKFRRRLPSFKPKVYTIPEPQYEPQQDGIQPPTLAHDIEKIIHKQNELGDVVREYEEMRSYINSVRTDTRLSRRDIPPPPNYHEVQAAQDELFDLINQISFQNEQQRSRIGVYELPKEEDPYNYRGINDDRQNYMDIEGATFSMQPYLSFESEQRVDMERQYAQRREQPLIEPLQQSYGDDQFASSPDGKFDPYGLPNGGIPESNGFNDGFYNEETPTGDGFVSDFTGDLADDFAGDLADDFSSDLTDDFAGDIADNFAGNSTDDFAGDFASDFAEDFDQAFDEEFGGRKRKHANVMQPQKPAKRLFGRLRGR